MSYKLKLEAIKTVKELFDFRDELKKDAEIYKDLWRLENLNSTSENLKKLDDVYYFTKRVEEQISYFEKQGMFLTSIEIPK